MALHREGEVWHFLFVFCVMCVYLLPRTLLVLTFGVAFFVGLLFLCIYFFGFNIDYCDVIFFYFLCSLYLVIKS